MIYFVADDMFYIKTKKKKIRFAILDHVKQDLT